MQQIIKVKDPETKKQLSIYNTLCKGELNILKRIYEIKDGDMSFLNERYGGLYPYDWVMRKGYYNIIDWFVQIGVKPRFNEDSFAKIYTFDLKNDFRGLIQLLKIPDVDMLTNCFKALTTTKYRREQFVQIMSHHNTRKLFYELDYGFIKEVKYDDPKKEKKDNIKARFFWITMMNINDDIFSLLEELGYTFNYVLLLQNYSEQHREHSDYYNISCSFKRVMINSLWEKVKFDSLEKDEKKIVDDAMFTLLWKNRRIDSRVKLLLTLYGDKYDFNRKYGSNKNISKSIIEDYVGQHDLKSLKLILKYQDKIVSNRLFALLFKNNIDLHCDKDYLNMYNFLYENYKEQLFCDDEMNWRFFIESNYTSACWFSTTFKTYLEAIIENCTNEKFKQMLTYHYANVNFIVTSIPNEKVEVTFTPNEKVEKILKYSFEKITDNLNYIEEYISIILDSVVQIRKNMIKHFNKSKESLFDINEYCFIKVKRLIPIYTKVGYRFSDQIISDPRWKEIEELKLHYDALLAEWDAENLSP